MDRYTIQQVEGLESDDIRFELIDNHSKHSLGWSNYQSELEDIKHLLDAL